MHVAIQVTAPAAEAYARVSYALKCLKQQVLSDNRSLEDLHWIANATKYLDGGGSSDAPAQRDVRPRPYSPQPPRQSSTRASYPPPPRRTASYDYPEDSYQYSV